MFIIILYVLLNLTLTISKDISDNERGIRAKFVQKLLNKQKHLEGVVKLVGGTNKFEGNVYIYHAGRWGAVCDDSWDDDSAKVVCRSFKKSGVATRGSQYGEASEKYWLDDVVCEGDEISLSHCNFSGWGSSDCELDEAAGVNCTGDLDNNTIGNLKMEQPSRLLEGVDINTTSLRLVGGKNTREGRVELYHEGVWGSLCPDGWTLYEAAVVCRHLALGYAAQALQTSLFGTSKVTFSGIRCESDETNLFMCWHNQFKNVFCPNQNGHVAAVVCTEYLADLHLDTMEIQRTAHLQDVPMFQLQCAMEENCLSRTAYEIQRTNSNWQFETRRLLRFTASSLNVGNADFQPYLPKHLWQWHLCHMHYHSMEVFATFDVLDSTGRRVAEGHKASFCLEDNTCLSGVEKKYSCKNYGDQGISVNCSDVYQYNIDCQWVDVTDLEPGDYTFKVAVNPHARVAEQRYHNNAAVCALRLTETYGMVYKCKLGRP